MSRMPATSGSTPPSAPGEVQAAAWVRRMFGDIAARYDLLNHLLSFNVDREGGGGCFFRAYSRCFKRPGALVLDLCCGTGDVLLEFQQSSRARVIGADFCHPMLVQAQRKIRSRRLTNPLLEADALVLPLADQSIDAVAISFGFRNPRQLPGRSHRTASRPEARWETRHSSSSLILRIPSCVGLTAFTPDSFCPWIGGPISGSREAYTYLPESIGKVSRSHSESSRNFHVSDGLRRCSLPNFSPRELRPCI